MSTTVVVVVLAVFVVLVVIVLSVFVGRLSTRPRRQHHESQCEHYGGVDVRSTHAAQLIAAVVTLLVDVFLQRTRRR